MTSLPSVTLDRGIHVMHLFYKIDRLRWSTLPAGESAKTLERLEALCAANAAASHPRLVSYANIGGKADFAFMIYAKELGQAAQIHRDLEAAFPPGTLQKVYSYLSVTELSEYRTTDEENRRLDGLALDALETLDPKQLYDVVTENNISMCGVLPAVIVLETLRRLGKLKKAERVAYATSADVTQDTSRVVGYAGVLLS